MLFTGSPAVLLKRLLVNSQPPWCPFSRPGRFEATKVTDSGFPCGSLSNTSAVNSTSQMRKPRHREVKRLAHNHKARGGSGNRQPGSEICAPGLHRVEIVLLKSVLGGGHSRRWHTGSSCGLPVHCASMAIWGCTLALGIKCPLFGECPQIPRHKQKGPRVQQTRLSPVPAPELCRPELKGLTLSYLPLLGAATLSV